MPGRARLPAAGSCVVRRQVVVRRVTGYESETATARDRVTLSGIRPLPPFDRIRKHRVRSYLKDSAPAALERPGRFAYGNPDPCSRVARHAAARWSRGTLSASTL